MHHILVELTPRTAEKFIIIIIIIKPLVDILPRDFKKIEKGNIMGMIISPCNHGPANYHVTRWREALYQHRTSLKEVARL